MEKDFYIQEVRVGRKVENFTAPAFDPQTGEFITVSLQENMDAGKWTILFFWPKDFTFVCPTEIIGFSDRVADFAAEDAVIYGVSTDSTHVHQAWTKLDPKDGGIGKVNFPLVQDSSHALSEAFGILIEEEGVALRGTFMISPEGVLEHSTINNLNVGRNVEESLRTLTALKSGGLCPLNWKKGDATLN
ncbi:peroxiredoxin [Mollicutes bacterium LVI A0039]|nr:peroxiredoxin [Mollicutes bacterium LVI A0039]